MTDEIQFLLYPGQLRGCKYACRTCSICKNADFPRCQNACRKCDRCSDPNVTGNFNKRGYFKLYDFGYYF